MTINAAINKYQKMGLKYADALAKTYQDIILSKISKSNFGDHIIIKGGVVLMNISKDIRRATQDLDLDFIRYSLADESIEAFINKLNNVDDGIKIKINGKIKALNQDDYKGKRVFVLLSDNDRHSYEIKLDLGVHTNLDLEQEELCFDLKSSFGSVTLLANSKEQIVAEKLKSILRKAEASTRFKDVFDIYYLTTIKKINVDKFMELITDYIFTDYKLKIKTFGDINARLNRIFSDNVYLKTLEKSEDNWLELPITKIIDGLLGFFKELELIPV